MKRMLILLCLVLISSTIKAQTLTVLASSKGIAPIPAFGRDYPVAMVFMKTNITKNLEFSPDFNYDLRNGKGWFMDTWVRWNQPLDTAGRFVVTAGIDWAFIYGPYGTNGNTVTQTVRYITKQARFRFNQNAENTFTLDYWHNSPAPGDRQYGITGSYLSFMYSRTEAMERFTARGNVNIFYISFTDGSQGVGSSYDASIAHNKTGMFLKTQFIHSVSPESSTNMKFGYNVTFGVVLKLK